MVVKRASEIDGTVECPDCGEVLGEANLKVLRGRNNACIRGGVNSTWAHIGVKHDDRDCGHEFEVGGQIGVTGESA